MHDQARDSRIAEAYRLALDRVYRKRLPLEVAKDIAQDTVIELYNVLANDGWQKRVCDEAMERTKKAVKENNKEEKMKDIAEINGGRRSGNEVSRAFIRDMAERSLLPREWQVVHRLYWHCKKKVVIAEELGISPQAVGQFGEKALLFLKQALSRDGITRETWNDWYYKGV